LLETGSTNLIRNTAAQQLAEVQKQHSDELFNLLSRVIPFLRSSKWDTRLAAAKAVGGIVENAARFDPNGDEAVAKPENGVKTEDGHGTPRSAATEDQLRLETLDVPAILRYGKKLLGSAGREYDYALAALEPAARLALQKRSLTARLGLGGEYIEEDFINDKDLLFTTQPSSAPTLPRVDTSQGGLSRKDSLQSPYPSADSPRGSFSGTPTEDGSLSKRQLNQLKRKSKAEARNQSRKVRVLDLGGYRPNPEPPQTPVAAEPHAVKLEGKREGSADGTAELFSLHRANGDDDSKVVSEFKGPQIPEKSALQAEAEEQGLEWPFDPPRCGHGPAGSHPGPRSRCRSAAWQGPADERCAQRGLAR
jgi:TATA-binding protein-associated factor